MGLRGMDGLVRVSSCDGKAALVDWDGIEKIGLEGFSWTTNRLLWSVLNRG